MRRFKDEREQFALVANEHCAIDGIVTLEDLLEEIVGEIYDETDRDIRAVQTGPDGALLLPGTFPTHDLDDLAIEITDAPDSDYATIAGLVLAALGGIPHHPGDQSAQTARSDPPHTRPRWESHAMTSNVRTTHSAEGSRP